MNLAELKNFYENLVNEINTDEADICFYDDDEDVFKKITSTYFYRNGRYSKRNKVCIHLERDFKEEE